MFTRREIQFPLSSSESTVRVARKSPHLLASLGFDVYLQIRSITMVQFANDIIYLGLGFLFLVLLRSAGRQVKPEAILMVTTITPS